jgi:hypothetical protein
VPAHLLQGFLNWRAVGYRDVPTAARVRICATTAQVISDFYLKGKGKCLWYDTCCKDERLNCVCGMTLAVRMSV